GKTRWAVTVAESHQPYFIDWVSELGWKFILLFIAGAILMFYETARHVKKSACYLAVIIFGIMAFLIGMSRYSPSSILDGESLLSHFAYFAPMLLLALIIFYGYLHYYKKEHEIYESIRNIDKPLIFGIVFFVLMVLAARTAMRLHFMLSPAIAITASYACFWLCNKAKNFKDKYYRYGLCLLVAIFIAVILFHYAQDSYNQAIGAGRPSYDPQWQNAMAWARENTNESDVFAHWWDYGYWVQWGAGRATLTDGGNAVPAINYFVGRHVLMANNETEALEYLKARGASHLLIINDDIGKYPAFSSIGSDRYYDRYSWIPLFTQDPKQTQETRNETVYAYVGGTALDDDFIFQNKLFPASASGIIGFMVPFANTSIGQASAVLIYNGELTYVPLDCVYFNYQEFDFTEQEKDVLQGCLMIIPRIQSNQMNPVGAAYYISPEVRKTLFAQLYLFDKDWEHIKIAYTDQDRGFPFMLYEGYPIGPLKIWRIDYAGTEDLIIPDYFYGTQVPDLEVEKR
ncbi:hypothetical protein HZB88_02620, partial [archaeon]|nr:hypothetical protein [archaeon]